MIDTREHGRVRHYSPAISLTKELAMDQQPDTLREAVGVFTSANDLQEAIDELQSSGFHRAELSLLANEEAVNEKLGERLCECPRRRRRSSCAANSICLA